jgi:hypothetical protein
VGKEVQVPRTVFKWRRLVHQILGDAIDDLTSLLNRNAKYKAKDPDSVILTDAEVVKINDALFVLNGAYSARVTR